MKEFLRAELGFKGERGYSAYEIALQNGFLGSEKDWLAQLGTTNSFSKNAIFHLATERQSSFDIPDNYTSDSFIDVYIEGRKLNLNEYEIDVESRKIKLIGFTLNEGASVEIIVWTINTNSFPIIETIDESSTNDTVTGSKAVYDYVQGETKKLKEEMQENIENAIPDNEKNIITAVLSKTYSIKVDEVGEYIKDFVEYNKIGSKLSVQNGVIKVGQGVSKVKVSYNAMMRADVVAERCFTYLMKNILSLSQENYYFNKIGQQITSSLSPIIVDVNEGDEFYLRVHGKVGNIVYGDTGMLRTLITVEVVE